MTYNREGFYDDGETRECTKCGVFFSKTTKMTICKDCNTKRVKSMTPEWKMHQRAKCRAKERDLEFDLEVSDIVIPEYCPILGIELQVNKGRSGAFRDSPSLDRIDNSKGYVKGNVQVISQQANAMKLNASKEDLLMFARWILEVYGEDN